MDSFFEAVGRLRENNPKAFAVVMEDLGRVFGAGASLEACRQFLVQMLTAEGAFFAEFKDFAKNFFPVVDLRSQYCFRGDLALVHVGR